MMINASNVIHHAKDAVAKIKINALYVMNQIIFKLMANVLHVQKMDILLMEFYAKNVQAFVKHVQTKLYKDAHSVSKINICLQIIAVKIALLKTILLKVENIVINVMILVQLV